MAKNMHVRGKILKINTRFHAVKFKFNQMMHFYKFYMFYRYQSLEKNTIPSLENKNNPIYNK